MEKNLKKLIKSILSKRGDLVGIALLQRAKFEGWLKFELANELKKMYADTVVEYHLKKMNAHVDIYSNQSLIELKTPNTSYNTNDCINAKRPITDNVNGIINDINKLKAVSSTSSYQGGYIAFVMFPLDKNEAYKTHIKKIADNICTGRITETILTINGVKILILTAKVF